MASSYDALLGTVSRIADAAIEWDMRDRGWWKGDDGWYSDSSIAPTSTYVLDFTGMYIRIIGEDGPSLHADEFATTADTDFRAIWRGWYERINDVYRPWLSLPDPAAFQASIDDVADAMSVLNVNTVVTANGAGESAELDSANGDLDTALRSFCGEAIAMGGAMDVFALAYSNRLPGVIQGQLAILSMLGCTLTAEQNLFEQLRTDIAQCADDVLTVMQDQNSGGPGDLLKVIGAVLAGASIFFTSGASAVLIANGGAVVSVLGAFVPEDKAQTEAERTYGGGTAMEVYDNLVEHLDKVKQIVREEEQIVSDSLTGAQGEVTGGSPDVYDLSARPALLSIPDTEIIDVDPSTMAFMGGVLAPFIGDNLAASRGQALQAPNRSAWERQGGIGLGSFGPYAEWESLLDTFSAVNHGTQTTLDDVGQKLIDVAALYVNTDDVVAQRQAELAGELELLEFDDATAPASTDTVPTPEPVPTHGPY